LKFIIHYQPFIIVFRIRPCDMVHMRIRYTYESDGHLP
jgi:hypothetical protein